MSGTELGGDCTVIVAAAGYGKTTAVRRWLGDVPARWVAGALPTDLADEPGWVVVDDLPGLAGADLRAALARRGAARLVLVFRWPPAAASRAGTPAAVSRAATREVAAPDLALTPAATAGVLRREYRLDEELAARVHDLTGGWAALVHAAGERLAITGPQPAGDGLAATLAAPGTAVATFLDKHVLTPLPGAVARLLRDAAHLDAAGLNLAGLNAAGPDAAGLNTVDEDLLRAAGHRRPERVLAVLRRAGLVTGRPGAARLVPLVAVVARDRWPLAAADADRLFGAAGDWYAGHGRPEAAIGAYHRCGRGAPAAALLRVHGPAWVIRGGAPTIAAAIAALDPADRDRDLRMLYGEALTVLGDDDRALAELSELAGPAGPLPAGLAWRLGAVHYLRGDPGAATATFARGRTAEPATAADAMLLAWDATARWMSGDEATCGDLARRALRVADAAGDDRARAAAHVALALHAMLAGDRPGNAAHHEHALRHAEAAGDVVQLARTRANLAARLIEEARYPQALAEARHAVELARATGYAPILAVAYCNEADALHRLGRLDEAADRYDRALTVFQRKGSGKVAYPLNGLGAIHRARGRPHLARAAYEEAARAAGATGHLQGLVPALAGLARVLAGSDPVAAAAVAGRARAAAQGPFVTDAVLATGWAQLGAGDAAAATRSAADAAAEAGRHRDSRGLAEALELRAAAATGPGEARTALREAAETWRHTGAPYDLDRVLVALGELSGAEVADRVAGRLARERLEAAGVARPARLGAAGPSRAAPAVVIRSLGRFEVTVGGTLVTMTTWQSRKARDLLRVLVARRGRSIAREELTEILWPGGDPDRLAHRLSVALSTVRSVLDPSRSADPDHYLLADRSGVALAVHHATVDLEVFLAEAAHGLAGRDSGRTGEARAVLAGAERRYTGEFLEHEPYEDWSVAAREEARATYLRVVRALADLSRRADRVDDAVAFLLKVLDKDPYDEGAHRDLIGTLATAGRHGEARRARARYESAMGEIGVVA
jgi:DNA-binding SARP family transcriptional activator